MMSAYKTSPHQRDVGKSRYAPRSYNSWQQVAGYFDGDGAVYVSAKKFVLRIRLCFYDVGKHQLENIDQFLRSNGIVTNRMAAQKGPPTTVCT